MALKTFTSEVLTSSDVNTYLVGPAPKLTRCTTTTTTSSDSVFSVPTGFASFTIAANSYYYYRYVITHSSAITTTGLVIRITQTATHNEGCINVFLAKSTNVIEAVAVDSSAGGDQTWTMDSGVSATKQPCTIEGYIEAGGSGGTLTFDFHSEVAASNVSVWEGSFGLLWELKAPI